MDLSEREKIIFRMLKRSETVSADAILSRLDEWGLPLVAERGSHSLGVLMKYLTAKVCQEGWIISQDGGRGRGNKSVFSMEKRF